MEEFYNRLVEAYREFPGDAIMVLHFAADPEWARSLNQVQSLADVEHALDQLDDWHKRMKAIIDSEDEEDEED